MSTREVSIEHELERKYGRFWSSRATDITNTRRLLRNYCVRDGLTWAPEFFQRVGKNRNKDQVFLVQSALASNQINTQLELITTINSKISSDSDNSLLNRLHYICLRSGIPFTRNKNTLELLAFSKPPGSLPHEVQVLADEQLTATDNSTCLTLDPAPQAFPLSSKVWDCYPHYSLLSDFSSLETTNQEDMRMASVDLTSEIKHLDEGARYLYVFDQQGQLNFAPPTQGPFRLTHAALARKAAQMSFSGDTPSVLAAGECAVFKTEKEIYVSLGSGHFEPTFSAYQAILSLFALRYPDYQIHMQGDFNIASSHFKPLDLRNCYRIQESHLLTTLALQDRLMAFIESGERPKLNPLLNDLQQDLSHKFDLDYQSKIEKLEDLEALFSNQELSDILNQNISVLPQALEEYCSYIKSQLKL